MALRSAALRAGDAEVTHDALSRPSAAWRRLVTGGQKSRYTYAQPDALIAATAQVHGLAVVTRTVEDFVQAGVPILNPWAPV